MRGGSLDAERKAAIAAIDSMNIATAWAWEKDARPGAYCAEAVCVGHARTSDVLILGSDLTPTTEKEYGAAAEAEGQRVILVKDGVSRQPTVKKFLEQERTSVATTKNFQNLSELRSLEFLTAAGTASTSSSLSTTSETWWKPGA